MTTGRQGEQKDCELAEERFAHYLDLLIAAIGRAGRAELLRVYTTGLLLPGEHESMSRTTLASGLLQHQ